MQKKPRMFVSSSFEHQTPIWWSFFLLAFLIVVPACTMHHPSLPDHDPAAGTAPGSLFSRDGLRVSRTEFAVQTWNGDYFLLGEGHTSACDHRVQANLVATLVQFGLRPAIGLEMVDVTRQGVLDRFNAGTLAVDELPDALDWNSTWGHDFDLYRPLFETAKRLELPLHALNLPKRVVDAVKAETTGDLSAEDAALIPDEIIPPKAGQLEALRARFRQHRPLFSTSKDRSLERFVLVQSLWDTQMALQAASARHRLDRPVAIIVGSGHVEFEWGIAHRLASIDPNARIVSVVPWRGLSEPDPAAGGYFFYCPLTHTSSLGYTLTLAFDRLEISRVEHGSEADGAGLVSGDLLVKVGGEEVSGLWDLHSEALRARREGRPLEMTVMRGGEPVVVRLETDENGTDASEGR